MKSHYQCAVASLSTDQQQIGYRVYRNTYHPSTRRLLLLHGAGVAGEDTWGHLVSYLDQWSEVLVPDLRGMGATVYADGVEYPCSAEEVLGDVLALLDHLQWWAFDLGGYSFGGLVSMLLKAHHPHRVHKQFLLESALLDRAEMAEVVRLRDRYAEAADKMRQQDDPELGIRVFLDAISPNRIVSPKSEQMTIARLAARPWGFAYALDAVTEASRRIDRDALLAAQSHVSSFVGGRSVEPMHAYQRQLEQQRDDWCYHAVRGCDHSLPFQKPRQIARLMNEEMQRYLAR